MAKRKDVSVPGYDVQRKTLRPFRVIVDADPPKQLPGCNYAYHDNALDYAMKSMNWVHTGTTLAVVKVDEVEKLIGSYTLHRNGDVTKYVHPHWHFKRARKQ